MAANVKSVIQWLKNHDNLDEGALVDQSELNRLLDSLWTDPPLRYQCSRDRCKATLAYWALHSHGARIAPGPGRKPPPDRVAGYYRTEARLGPSTSSMTVGGVAAAASRVIAIAESRFGAKALLSNPIDVEQCCPAAADRGQCRVLRR